MTQETFNALKRALLASSEPLRALILSFLVVLLRELVPGLQDAPLEAILAPLIGYMIAKGLRTLPDSRSGNTIPTLPANKPADLPERWTS